MLKYINTNQEKGDHTNSQTYIEKNTYYFEWASQREVCKLYRKTTVCYFIKKKKNEQTLYMYFETFKAWFIH